MNICNLLAWLTGCGLCGPAMAVSCQKGQRSGSCLVHRSGCLISPNLIGGFWGMPRELLGSILHWNQEEIGYDSSGGMSQQQGRWTCGWEGGQAGKKHKLHRSMSFYVGHHQKLWLRFRWVFQPQMIQPRKSPTGMPNAWFWLIQVWLSWQPRLSSITLNVWSFCLLFFVFVLF